MSYLNHNWRWSDRSLERLGTCRPELRQLMHGVLVHSPVDVTVICGYRSEEEQLRLFASGDTQVRWSKHNEIPSSAVDIAPLTPDGKIDWNDLRRFFLLAGVVASIASGLRLDVRWGGDWDRDTDLDDQKFNDYVHWELV